MTIKDTQLLIQTWNDKNGIIRDSLESVAVINEKTANLARIMSTKKAKSDTTVKLAVAELLWELVSLAGAENIDLTESVTLLLENKNRI